MSKEIENSSLVEQIISRTIALLSEREEFDEGILDRIEQLLRSTSTTKFEDVVNALSADKEKSI